MLIKVTIPIDIYNTLEQSCVRQSPEYLMLKNGIIAEGRTEVIILCQAERALNFLAWANQKVPERSKLITLTVDT
jgi:hypothetical protein